MTSFINSFWSTVLAPALVVGDRVLATRTAVAVLGPAPVATPFDAADAYDTFNGHDTVTNNTRITFPDAALIRAGGQTSTVNGGDVSAIRKNGTSVYGLPARTRAAGGGLSTRNISNLNSAPVLVSLSDYLELIRENLTTRTHEANFNWFFSEVLDGSLEYSLIKKGAAQVINPSAATILSWQAVEVDSSSWYSSLSPTRISPTGVDRVRVIANVNTTTEVDAGTDLCHVYMRKNGGAVPGLASKTARIISLYGEHTNIASAVLNLTPGDFFEIYELCANTCSVAANEDTWFCVEAIPDTTKCALVRRTSNIVIPHSVDTALAWTTAEYDDDSMFNVSNPTRLTVPAGVTKARLSFNLRGTNTLEVLAFVTKNGSIVAGLPGDKSEGVSSYEINGLGAWVEVVEGDYFELVVFSPSNPIGVTLGSSSYTWFCMEAAP